MTLRDLRALFVWLSKKHVGAVMKGQRYCHTKFEQITLFRLRLLKDTNLKNIYVLIALANEKQPHKTKQNVSFSVEPGIENFIV